MSTLTAPPPVADHRSSRAAPPPIDDDPATTFADTDPPDPPGESRREWVAIAAGISALLSLMAIIISFVALSSSSGTTQTMPMAMSTPTPAAAAAPAVPTAAPQSVTMAFRSDTEHGRRGPDGTWHDAGLPAVYSVRAGARVTVTLLNYDTSPHSFTAPGLGVDQIVAGGSPTNPSRTTFSYTAPQRAGRYAWWCKFPCDPWAMTHVGYMRGYVTVRA